MTCPLRSQVVRRVSRVPPVSSAPSSQSAGHSMSDRRIIRGAPVPVVNISQGDDLVEQKRQNRLRKAFATATDIGLTRPERHELAQMLSTVDKDSGGSWQQLNPIQLHELINLMEGYIYVKHILDSRQ